MAARNGRVWVVATVIAAAVPGWAAADSDVSKVRALERAAAEAEVRLCEAKVTAARKNLDVLRKLHADRTGGLTPMTDLTAAEVAVLAAERDLAVARVAAARVAEPTDAKPNPRIDALRRERLQALRTLAEVTHEQFRMGRITVDEVRRAELERLGAELDLAKSHFDKVAVRERVVKAAKEFEDAVAARVKQGQATEADLVRAKAFRLEAEIGLEQERAAGS